MGDVGVVNAGVLQAVSLHLSSTAKGLGLGMLPPAFLRYNRHTNVVSICGAQCAVGMYVHMVQ